LRAARFLSRGRARSLRRAPGPGLRPGARHSASRHKAGNLLLTNDGAVKLCDLASRSICGSPRRSSKARRPAPGVHGARAGARRRARPPRRPLCPRATFYHAVAGVPPSTARLSRKFSKRKCPRRPAPQGPRSGCAAAPLPGRCQAPCVKPDDRYASAEEAEAALRAAMHAAAPAPHKGAAARAASRRKASVAGWLAAVAVVLAVLAPPSSTSSRAPRSRARHGLQGEPATCSSRRNAAGRGLPDSSDAEHEKKRARSAHRPRRRRKPRARCRSRWPA